MIHHYYLVGPKEEIIAMGSAESAHSARVRELDTGWRRERIADVSSGNGIHLDLRSIIEATEETYRGQRALLKERDPDDKYEQSVSYFALFFELYHRLLFEQRPRNRFFGPMYSSLRPKGALIKGVEFQDNDMIPIIDRGMERLGYTRFTPTGNYPQDLRQKGVSPRQFYERDLSFIGMCELLLPQEIQPDVKEVAKIKQKMEQEP